MLADFFDSWFSQPVRPRVVVIGNSKGGTGKTTTAIHLISGLLNYGYSVGCVDLDGAQATLSHFIDNRTRFAATGRISIEVPAIHTLHPCQERSLVSAEANDGRRFAEAFRDLIDRDYIVVDTPGSDSLLSRLGHTMADNLVTPINDSFLDLDVLVRVDHDSKRILGPSGYALSVLDRWAVRNLLSGDPIEWTVMRNRVAPVASRNQARLATLLDDLAPRLGFRLVKGFGERVIFRELFLSGLTVLDPLESVRSRSCGDSSERAKSEVWNLLREIGLPLPRIEAIGSRTQHRAIDHGSQHPAQ